MTMIKRIVREFPQHWVGDGFPVRNMFSYHDGNEFDPFLLLDYAGPYEFEAGEARRGVGEHPHRGFETVTILFQGELEHRDSGGSHGTIAAGDVQWMTAASGVVHEEFHSRRFAQEGGTLEMMQLWVNLPADKKMSSPRYQDLRNDQFPRVQLTGEAGTARVIAGQLLDATGPASTFTPINIWDLAIKQGASINLPIPPRHTSLLVFQSGSATVDEQQVSAGDLVQLERNDSAESIAIATTADARIVVLTGQPINEPVVGKGPFVMNTREEISQAIQDFKAGKMGRLPSSRER